MVYYDFIDIIVYHNILKFFIKKISLLKATLLNRKCVFWSKNYHFLKSKYINNLFKKR